MLVRSSCRRAPPRGPTAQRIPRELVRTGGTNVGAASVSVARGSDRCSSLHPRTCALRRILYSLRCVLPCTLRVYPLRMRPHVVVVPASCTRFRTRSLLYIHTVSPFSAQQYSQDLSSQYAPHVRPLSPCARHVSACMCPFMRWVSVRVRPAASDRDRPAPSTSIVRTNFRSATRVISTSYLLATQACTCPHDRLLAFAA